MGLYRWNSGGQYRGKLWEQDLLADSQVCTWLCQFQAPPSRREFARGNYEESSRYKRGKSAGKCVAGCTLGRMPARNNA